MINIKKAGFLNSYGQVPMLDEGSVLQIHLKILVIIKKMRTIETQFELTKYYEMNTVNTRNLIPNFFFY